MYECPAIISTPITISSVAHSQNEVLCIGAIIVIMIKGKIEISSFPLRAGGVFSFKSEFLRGYHK